MSAAQLDYLARKSNHSLDERLRAVERIPENDYVSTLDRLEAIDKFVDEDPLLIAQKRSHAGSFHLHRLVKKNDDDQREAEGDGEVACPTAQIVPQLRSGHIFRRVRRAGIRDVEHFYLETP